MTTVAGGWPFVVARESTEQPLIIPHFGTAGVLDDTFTTAALPLQPGPYTFSLQAQISGNPIHTDSKDAASLEVWEVSLKSPS